MFLCNKNIDNITLYMYNDNTYCSDKHRQTHMHNYLYIIIIHITEFLFSINLIKNCFIM